MKIAAMTDIHAMGALLDQALNAARDEGFDALVIMGDLLSYGVEPRETIALVKDAVARDGAILLSGNHDLMYRPSNDASAYIGNLPDWLRETVSWTNAQISPGVMDAFDWHEEWTTGPLFVAHANPYVFGDWRYISSLEDAEIAASVLATRGFSHGLFGHTHRTRTFDCADATVFTIGSLGQPRDTQNRQMQWAMLDVTDEGVRMSPRTLDFDRQAHLESIRATSMSTPTKDRLCGYFA
jgi:predicted phosphodiesterase